jgi:nucleoside-diphosphate-sugar epimerase
LLADIPPRDDGADGADATVDESIDIARAVRPGTWRLDVERRVIDAGGGDLATAVVRVGAVYGGVGGSFPDLFHHARTTGTLGHVGDGANRWSLIHRDDLADLFATIVERDGRGVFHGVDGAPLAMREIMALVARGAAAHRGGAVDVHGVAPDQARSELPYYASVLACDLAMVTPRARALGWMPTIASFRDGVVATASDVLG